MRRLLLGLSVNRTARRWAERSRIGRRMAERFVAGETVAEAIAVCRHLNARGMAVSLDALGESVTDSSEARAAGEVYLELLEAIGQEGLHANVSLKLSQMGLNLSPELAEQIVGEVVERAAALGGFVRIDMEGSGYTETTLAITERLHGRFPGAVGTVLQAALRRSEDDTARLLRQRIRIRLCKGAYREPAQIAFPTKKDVDENYVRLMRTMVGSRVFCGIATHDPAMLDATQEFVEESGLGKDAFEFQMLYGIRRDLQRSLAEAGYGVRVYVPFGTSWFPYFMRRLAERPANLIFLLKNLFR